MYYCYEGIRMSKTLSACKVGRDAENRGTVVLMNARIICMIVNACLRTVKLKTGIHVHIC